MVRQGSVARAGRDELITAKVGENNAITDALVHEKIGREVEVGLRHAMLARSLQRIALERLAALCPKDLSPALALRMLRLGLEEERMALGLTKAAGETIASHWQG